MAAESSSRRTATNSCTKRVSDLGFGHIEVSGADEGVNKRSNELGDWRKHGWIYQVRREIAKFRRIENLLGECGKFIACAVINR